MQAEVIIYIIVFLYGIVLGSFLNVLIYRIPKKENITIEPSHCMNCGERIQWYDLIPIVSYVILKGKCRNCKAEISIQYPVIEVVNGLAYVLIFIVNGFSVLTVMYCLLASIFLAISIIDFRTYEIPLCFNVAVAVLAVARLIMEPDNLVSHLIGFVSVSGFMLICLVAGRALKGVDAFGGGDIKLMAAAGLFLGAGETILGFLIGCVLGAVIHTIRMKLSGEENVLAFGPYLCGGLFISILFGDVIINWYLGFML